MKKLILVVGLVAVAVACSESAPGVGEDTAEITCRTWCDPINTCGEGYSSPSECLDRCTGEAQEICGEHHHAKRLCELELNCNDPFEDCNVHDEDRNQCRTDLMAQCAEQCPEAGPLCFEARGDCGLATDCAERCPLTWYECVQNGGQCGAQDVCQQECPPTEENPDRTALCLHAEGDCVRVDACAAACLDSDSIFVCVTGGVEPGQCSSP
jgi:hypothetical protein